jgi:hypothetical protein
MACQPDPPRRAYTVRAGTSRRTGGARRRTAGGGTSGSKSTKDIWFARCRAQIPRAVDDESRPGVEGSGRIGGEGSTCSRASGRRIMVSLPADSLPATGATGRRLPRRDRVRQARPTHAIVGSTKTPIGGMTKPCAAVPILARWWVSRSEGRRFQLRLPKLRPSYRWVPRSTIHGTMRDDDGRRNLTS